MSSQLPVRSRFSSISVRLAGASGRYAVPFPLPSGPNRSWWIQSTPARRWMPRGRLVGRPTPLGLAPAVCRTVTVPNSSACSNVVNAVCFVLRAAPPVPLIAVADDPTGPSVPRQTT